jgi:Family of unknown function (DUF5985)
VIFNLGLCALAVLTCAACMVLLFRAYGRHRRRVLLWSAICFLFLTLNNVLLFLDLVVIEQDLRTWRNTVALLGLLLLISGLLAERE